MDQITHDVRRQNWLNIVTACQNRPEGINAHQWLADNGIKEKAYYYWLRKFRKEAVKDNQLSIVNTSNEVSFVEMPLSVVNVESSASATNSAATIHKNGMTIEISNSISAPLLSLLVQEVFHA